MQFSIRLPLGVLVLGLFAVGCAGATDAQRREADIEGGPPGASRIRRDLPEPLLLVRGWPLDDGSSQYRLTWDGGDSRLPLFEEPDADSELIAELAYKPGQEILTDGDFVAVHKPAIFHTRHRLTVEGFVHDPESSSAARVPFSKKLKKGASLSVFGYAADGRCYAGVGGRIIVMPCPTPKDYSGTFEGPTLAFQMQPLGRTWWVHVSTPVASGWVPLDEVHRKLTFPNERRIAREAWTRLTRSA